MVRTVESLHDRGQGLGLGLSEQVPTGPGSGHMGPPPPTLDRMTDRQDSRQLRWRSVITKTPLQMIA